MIIEKVRYSAECMARLGQADVDKEVVSQSFVDMEVGLDLQADQTSFVTMTALSA